MNQDYLRKVKGIQIKNISKGYYDQTVDKVHPRISQVLLCDLQNLLGSLALSEGTI